jgi:acyl-CoA thioester hydrolase
LIEESTAGTRMSAEWRFALPWMYHRRIAWADVDLTGQWRFTSALLIVEEAETDLMRSAGLIALLPRLPRVAVSVSFSRPALFDEDVQVSLDLVAIGRSSIQYAFEITGPAGMCADGRVVAVYTNRGGRPMRVPTAVRRSLQAVSAAAETMRR